MTDVCVELTVDPVQEHRLTIHLNIHTIFRKLASSMSLLVPAFSFLPSFLQFCFYCIHLKFNFPRCLVNQSNVPLTTIASRQIQPAPRFPPLSRRVPVFGERSGNEEEREDKGISAHVRPRRGRSQMRASLRRTCGRERDGSQSLWRQLENSPEPRLIESLSSSLWASWAVGVGFGGAVFVRGDWNETWNKQLAAFETAEIRPALTLWRGGARPVWVEVGVRSVSAGIMCVSFLCVWGSAYRAPS